MWKVGEMLLDDLDAVINGLQPQRLQVAQPETVARYTRA
jgi:hypothetical protein